MNFVLDASVALSWCFEGEGGEYATRVLDALRHGEAVVSPLWAFEVTNGLVWAERRHRLKVEEVMEAGELLQALPLLVEDVEPHRVFGMVQRLARTHRISTYDAACLALAIRHGLPVATLSLELRRAVTAEGLRVFEGIAAAAH